MNCSYVSISFSPFTGKEVIYQSSWAGEDEKSNYMYVTKKIKLDLKFEFLKLNLPEHIPD